MDVAVIGGGLVGLAIADALARRGAQVAVYDRGEPAKSASWAGAGMLAPYSEALEGSFHGPLAQLGVRSLEMYRGFVDDLASRTGVDARLRFDGSLHVALEDAEAETFVRAASTLQAAGAQVELLDRAGTIARESMLAQGVRAGLWIAAEGQVDNRRLGRALVEAVRLGGVRLEANCGEIALDADDRRVRGIRTQAGYRAAGAVVNAAGAWASALEGVPQAARVAVHPVKGQMLALAVPAQLVTRLIWGPGASVYLVPRDDGRLLVGATVEDAGFDVRVTAAGVRSLLDAALRAAPSLGGFALSETWAGVRPGSADGLPFIGATGVEGYFTASGHFRSGILLTPITAALVASAVAGEAPPGFAVPLRPGRGTEAAAACANHPA